MPHLDVSPLAIAVQVHHTLYLLHRCRTRPGEEARRSTGLLVMASFVGVVPRGPRGAVQRSAGRDAYLDIEGSTVTGDSSQP